jgi:hypothetical protein
MEKQIKNKDLQVILEGIYRCGNQSKQPFRRYMMHNAKVIKAELEGLFESEEKVPGWEQYEEARNAIVDVYAIGRHQNNEPIFGENETEAMRKFTELKIKYQDLLAKKREASKYFFDKVMELPIAIELFRVSETELPKELTLDQALGIELLINFTDINDKSVKSDLKED